MKNKSSVWWLEVLDNVEWAKDSSDELIRKIGEAILGSTNNSRSSKLGSRLVLLFCDRFDWVNLQNVFLI